MKRAVGIHRTRLAASELHRLFVKEARRTVQELGWQASEDGISPMLVGATPLPFSVPDSFEAAFGYRGNLRFVQFGYTASRQFGYSDGGDDLPSDANLWSWFIHHRAIAPHLPETQYPTLYGKFPSGSERSSLLEQIMRRGADLPTCHCLLLDRRDRRVYITERDQAMILFALMEPDQGDAHNVFVDGMLMSPGSEDYKVPPAQGLLDEFRRFVDGQDKVPQRA
jgi:hypothetical protein